MKPRKQKSQWEFGDLFSGQQPEPERRVLSVSELTGRIRRLIESDIGQVWVTGEISNFRQQSSGHIYFTLKDADSQVSCVLFRGQRVAHRESLADGQKMVVLGEATVYEPRGQYQLVVRDLEPQGLGALQLAFERLKRKLDAEGLFDPERKRPLPRICRRIGVVTSSTGAALRDVLHVIRRRQPDLEIILAPCRVQGSGAADEIAAAVSLLNEWMATEPERHRLDLILVTRGGGSLEDLWAFNEEVVARAVAASSIPVVSAVGHEIDFTISDFVADLRAATPSAAAELITEAAVAARQFVEQAAARLVQLARRRRTALDVDLEHLVMRLGRSNPRRWIEGQYQQLDEWVAALSRVTRQRCREAASQNHHLRVRLMATRPRQAIDERQRRVHELGRRLARTAHTALTRHLSRLASAQTSLQLLSPTHVLQRGYSITIKEDSGEIVRSADQVGEGVAIETRLGRGRLRSTVQKVLP